MPFLITGGMGSPGDGTDGLYVALTVVSVTNFGATLAVQFSASVILSGAATLPSNWVITGGGGEFRPVTITSVTSSGNTVTLGITEQTAGVSYNLNIPPTGIVSAAHIESSGPNVQPFIGIGVAPVIVLARPVDARTLDVIFSEDMASSYALNTANYSISGGVAVSSVSQLSPSTYRLVVSPLTPSSSYTVTATNTKDAAGNPT